MSIPGTDPASARVLLVDDDEDAYVLTREYFRDFADARYKLEWTDSYDGVLESMARSAHDLYLIDYQLGARSGLELMEDAARIHCSRPMILLTGMGDREVDIAAMRAGAADYLVKGQLNSPILERSIRYALDRQQTMEALRRSEERYRYIVETATDVIYKLDTRGRIVFVNPTAARLLPSTDADGVARCFLDLFQPPYREEIARAIGLPPHEVRERGYFEAPMTLRDGAARWFGHNTQPVVENGAVIGVQGVARDVTERVDAEQKQRQYLEKLQRSQALLLDRTADLQRVNESLRRSERELRDLNASKDRFFSIVAHDLKNPFVSLLGFSELMVSEFDSFEHNELRDFAHSMYASTKHVYGLLENLLEWSRIRTGRMEFQPVSFDLRELVEQSVAVLGGGSMRKNIGMQVDIPEGVRVHADRHMATSVIQNLLTNAVKFSHPGGTVAVSARVEERFAAISVADTGIGIPPEVMDSLFRIDRSVSTRGTSDEKGTGLGLILCKELVATNGGSITVHSAPGSGSTFTFTLPLGAKETDAEHPTVEAAPPDMIARFGSPGGPEHGRQPVIHI